MGWVFEKIVEVVMQVISFIMAFLALQLVDVFKLDGKDTLKYFFSVFNGLTHDGPTATLSGAVGGGIFYQLYQMCMYAGLALIFLGMVYNLYKAFFGNLAQADPPGKTVWKSIVFALLCGWAQNIVALILDITTIPFNAITKNISVGTFATSILERFLKGAANMGEDLISSPLAGGSLAGGVKSIVDNVGFGGAIFDVKFYTSIIAIVLFIMMIKNFMALALEMAERYLMIGVLCVFSPICVACGAVRATQDVFANWMAYMVNACVVLTLNTFFLVVFIFNFTASASIPYLLLWIAWIKTGQKLDEHMSGLGLKTAKTGGFGMDVMQAMRTSLPVALGAADKFAGTRLGGLYNSAMSGGTKSAGPGWGLWKNDPRLGEKFAGTKSLKEGTQKKAAGLSGKLNKAKEAMNSSTGHGSRTGISHEQLSAMAKNGTLPKPGQPGFENAAKDMLDMKAGKDENGKSLTEQLDKQGYKIKSMENTPDGGMKFTAEDDKGNKIAGELSNNVGEGSGNITMNGENGKQMGLSLAQEQKDGMENALQIGDTASEGPDDKADTAALPDTKMEETGVVTPPSDDDAQGPEKTDEGGNAADFNNVETNGGENGVGEEAGESSGIEGQIETDDGQKMTVTGSDPENGTITATDEDGNEHTLQANEDGSFTEVGDKSTDNSMSFTDQDGNTWTSDGKTDENGNMTFTDENGNSQTVTQGEDGTLKDAQGNTINGADGNPASLSESATMSTTADGQKFEDANGTTWTSTGEQNADGTMTFTDGQGNTQNLSVGEDGAVKDANGNQVGTAESAKIASSQDYSMSKNDDGTYTGTAADGSTAQFQKNDDGSFSQLTNAQSVQEANFDGANVNMNGQNAQLSKNADGSYSATTQNADGSSTTATFADNGNGGLNKVAETTTSGLDTQDKALSGNDKADVSSMSANIGGKDYHLEQTGAGEYKGTASDGSTVNLAHNDDGSWTQKATDKVDTANMSASIGGKDYKLSTNSQNGGMTATATDGSGATMQLSQSKNGQWEASTTTMKDSNGKSFNVQGYGNENKLTGTAADGSTATFTKGADGNYTKTSESRQFDTSKGITMESTPVASSNVSKDANGGISAVSVGGKTYGNMQDIGNGQMVGTATDGSGQTARFQSDGNGNVSLERAYAHDNNGQKFQVADSAVNTSITRNGDGSVSVQKADGSSQSYSQAEAAKQGFTTSFTNDKGETKQLGANENFSANYNASTGKMDISAGSEKVSSPATISAGNYKFNSDTNFTKNSDGSYTGTDVNGTKRTVSSVEMGTAQVSAGTTSWGPNGNGRQSIAVANASGTMAHVANNNFSSASANQSQIVKNSEDGSYFRTVGTQRYDKGGVPNPNGSYMMTIGQDGSTNFKPVAVNENGTISTYKMNNDAAQIKYQMHDGSYASNANGELQSKNAKNIDSIYGMPSKGQAATNLISNGQNYSIAPQDQRTGQPQMFVDMGSNGNHDWRPLDMDKCQFNESGSLKSGSPIHVLDNNGQSQTVDRSQLFSRKGNQEPELYYRGTNTKTNQEQYLNADRNSTSACVEIGAYQNGNNINLDLSNAKFEKVCDNGKPDGRVKVDFGNGQTTILRPANSNMEGMYGSHVQIGGKNYISTPGENNIINSVASNVAPSLNKGAWNFNENIAPVQVTDTNALRTLRQTFGIPEDATNVRMMNRKNTGAVFTYEQKDNSGKRHTYAITGTKLSNGGIGEDEPIKGPNGTNIGYKQECKPDQIRVAKSINLKKSGMNIYYDSPGRNANKKKRR